MFVLITRGRVIGIKYVLEDSLARTRAKFNVAFSGGYGR